MQQQLISHGFPYPHEVGADADGAWLQHIMATGQTPPPLLLGGGGRSNMLLGGGGSMMQQQQVSSSGFPSLQGSGTAPTPRTAASILHGKRGDSLQQPGKKKRRVEGQPKRAMCAFLFFAAANRSRASREVLGGQYVFIEWGGERVNVHREGCPEETIQRKLLD